MQINEIYQEGFKHSQKLKENGLAVDRNGF